MNFGRRLRAYLVGLGFGLLMVYFIYAARGCEWTPGNRVITSIKESEILISDFKRCQMDCYGITKHDVFNVIRYGEVDFSESQTSGDVKDYVVEGDSLTITFSVSSIDSTAIVSHFHGYKEVCACGQIEERYSTLYQPNDMVLQQLVDNGFEVTRTSDCLFECYGVDSAYARSVLDDGFVLNDWSFPFAKPNPVYWIEKVRGPADTLLFKLEEGSKTRVIDIKRRNMKIPCDCN